MESLKSFSKFQSRPGPLVFVVMDGIGLNSRTAGNAVAAAHTPTLDRLMKNCPTLSLKAHGKAVGLPSDNDMGNSEVGHNAIGAGRVFHQGARLVNEAIETGRLWQGETWKKIIGSCLSRKGILHFIGLFSDGNVHSHINHLKAMLVQAKKEGILHARIHILLDGRDVGETSALDYVLPFEAFLDKLNREGADFSIASGGGRMVVTMDRYEADWSIVERGWEAHVRGRGELFPDAETAIRTLRNKEPGITDQFLPPFVIGRDGKPLGPVRSGDSVIFFNFRGDRAIEISLAFESSDFDKFSRDPRPRVEYAGMMEYDGDLRIPKQFLVSPPAIDRTMGELLSNTGVSQLACSETQKFGHITYFWNGNWSGAFNDKLETYIEIPSDRVPFEQRPWMKSAEITDRILQEMKSGKHRFIRLNYANGDMVGHTGVFHSAVLAVESVDLALSRLMRAVEANNGMAIITADHGNAEEMFETDDKGNPKSGENGEPKPKTSHTLNPVPFIIFDPNYKEEYRIAGIENPGLSNIAATCLQLLGYKPPAYYDPSLIEFK
jgi:2,3-bisphosphoglycerate-independent phosphoglycerate mutase